MSDHTEDIKEYYADAQLEWDRLEGSFAHEKYITVHMMDRYLPDKGSILDIGGGPGHYSIYYAARGYDVTLFDLSRENLALAKKKAEESGVSMDTVQGNALDLSMFRDEMFDAVFLMGPLYHLTEPEDRKKALKEAVRVLRKGGYLFSSFILTFGNVIYSLRSNAGAILDDDERKHLDAIADDESLAFRPFSFTYAYETTVEGAKELIGSNEELNIETVFGQEGILAPYCGVLAEMPEDERLAWYDYSLRFCEKEEYLSHAEHLMVVSKKN